MINKNYTETPCTDTITIYNLMAQKYSTFTVF